MSKAVLVQPNSRAVLAKKKRRVFLGVLAKTGRVAEASRACGYTDTSTLTAFRRNDEEFAEAWDDALLDAAHVLEEEIWRRAHDGIMEPVFYKGKVTGHKRQFSDTLAMFIWRGIKPGTYRDSQRGGDMNINFGIAVMPATASDDGQWEESAVNMHSRQKVITIEAKPVENTLSRIQRSD